MATKTIDTNQSPFLEYGCHKKGSTSNRNVSAYKLQTILGMNVCSDQLQFIDLIVLDWAMSRAIFLLLTCIDLQMACVSIIK